MARGAGMHGRKHVNYVHSKASCTGTRSPAGTRRRRHCRNNMCFFILRLIVKQQFKGAFNIPDIRSLVSAEKSFIAIAMSVTERTFPDMFLLSGIRIDFKHAIVVINIANLAII